MKQPKTLCRRSQSTRSCSDEMTGVSTCTARWLYNMRSVFALALIGVNVNNCPYIFIATQTAKLPQKPSAGLM